MVLSVAAVALHGRLEVEAGERRLLPDGDARVRRIARRWVAGSGAVLAAGLVLLLAFAWWGAWPYLSLVSASLIGVGAGVCASALPFATKTPGTVAGLWVIVVAAAFWAVSIIAEWSGRGQAQQVARDLDALPAVILDSPADLHLRNTVAAPEDLCWVAGPSPDPACAALTDEPRYRYRGLRLLVQGPSAIFLVPTAWSPSATTLHGPAQLRGSAAVPVREHPTVLARRVVGQLDRSHPGRRGALRRQLRRRPGPRIPRW